MGVEERAKGLKVHRDGLFSHALHLFFISSKKVQSVRRHQVGCIKWCVSIVLRRMDIARRGNEEWEQLKWRCVCVVMRKMSACGRRPHEGRVCIYVCVCMNHLNKLLAGFSNIFGWCTYCWPWWGNVLMCIQKHFWFGTVTWMFKKKSLVNGANPCNVFQFVAHVPL